MLEQKRFVKKLLLSLLPLGVAAGALLSCSNLSSSGTEGGASSTAEHAKFTGTGARVYVSLPGQGRSAAARSAVPSAFEDANGDLIFAGAIYESSSTPPPLKAAEYTPASGGTPASIVVPFDIFSSARASCVLELYAFASDYDSSAGFEENDALLSVQILNIAIAANEESLDLGTVAMQPHSATAQGSVSLAVTLPADCALSCSCATGNFDFSSGTITATNIASGAHTVNFSVTKGGQTAYSWTEIIYVYPGMVTNAWNTGEGGSTERVINATQMYSTFYVRGTGSTWFDAFGCSQDADDANNNGSLAKPYKYLQNAIDKVIAINDGTTEYTIYVDGTVTAASGTPNGTAVATIENTKNLNLTISALTSSSTDKTAIFDGENTRRVIYAKGGSGILTLTLNDLAIINGKINASGGGIRADDKKIKLYINRCLIDNNKAERQNSASGGGIYAVRVSGSILQITDSEISNNTSNYNGGGLATFGYQKGEAYIIRTKFLNNKTTTTDPDAGGGGIGAVGGSYIYIENCTEFSGNTSTNLGNGICAGTGKIILTGQTKIDDEIYFKSDPIQIASDFSLSGTTPIPIVPEMNSSVTGYFAPNDRAIIKGLDEVNDLSATDADKLNAFKIVDTNYTIEYSTSKKGGIIKEVSGGGNNYSDYTEMTLEYIQNNWSDEISGKDVKIAITISDAELPTLVSYISSANSVELLLKEDSTLTKINEKAFNLCTKLTSIVIPSSVTQIGRYAFYFTAAVNITSVTFANTSGWYATTDSSYNGGTPITVTDPAQNATNFKTYSSTELSAWNGKYLYRNP